LVRDLMDTSRKAEIIYDGTVFFCRRYFDKYDRTIDQMVQAARSGKQNIAEAFLREGGLRERMTKARTNLRKKP
jgi:hypothetical protein